MYPCFRHSLKTRYILFEQMVRCGLFRGYFCAIICLSKVAVCRRIVSKHPIRALSGRISTPLYRQPSTSPPMQGGISMSLRRQVFFYGTVGLQRTVCPRCKSWCIVTRDDRTPCCGVYLEFDDTEMPFWYRPCITSYKRRGLRIGDKQHVLEMQNYCCAYCGKEFGSIVYKDWQEVTLSVHFDHCIPFAFNQDNRPANFVAACHVCNGLKSDLHFRDMQQAREYLALARKDKGYDF